MKSEFYSKYQFPKTAKDAILILGSFMLSEPYKLPPMKLDLLGCSCFNHNHLKGPSEEVLGLKNRNKSHRKMLETPNTFRVLINGPDHQSPERM